MAAQSQERPLLMASYLLHALATAALVGSGSVASHLILIRVSHPLGAMPLGSSSFSSALPFWMGASPTWPVLKPQRVSSAAAREKVSAFSSPTHVCVHLSPRGVVWAALQS